MKNGKRYRNKAHYDKARKGMFANMGTASGSRRKSRVKSIASNGTRKTRTKTTKMKTGLSAYENAEKKIERLRNQLFKQKGGDQLFDQVYGTDSHEMISQPGNVIKDMFKDWGNVGSENYSSFKHYSYARILDDNILDFTYPEWNALVKFYLPRLKNTGHDKAFEDIIKRSGKKFITNKPEEAQDRIVDTLARKDYRKDIDPKLLY
jgi:hypothetical protein